MPKIVGIGLGWGKMSILDVSNRNISRFEIPPISSHCSNEAIGRTMHTIEKYLGKNNSVMQTVFVAGHQYLPNIRRRILEHAVAAGLGPNVRIFCWENAYFIGATEQCHIRLNDGDSVAIVTDIYPDTVTCIVWEKRSLDGVIVISKRIQHSKSQNTGGLRRATKEDLNFLASRLPPRNTLKAILVDNHLQEDFNAYGHTLSLNCTFFDWKLDFFADAALTKACILAGDSAAPDVADVVVHGISVRVGVDNIMTVAKDTLAPHERVCECPVGAAEITIQSSFGSILEIEHIDVQPEYQGKPFRLIIDANGIPRASFR